MPTQTNVPPEVKHVRVHLDRGLDHAAAGFVSADKDEDTITGDIGVSLRSGRRQVLVEPSSSERLGGGVGESRTTNSEGAVRERRKQSLVLTAFSILRVAAGGRRERKSFLFRAKLAGRGEHKLLEQAMRLSAWREAATVISYGQAGYRAADIGEKVADRGGMRRSAGSPLADYHGTGFLDCYVGDSALYYDAPRRRLVWRAMDGEMVATQFSISHRLRVAVEAPTIGPPTPPTDRVVRPDDAHRYRMDAEDARVLSVDGAASVKSVRVAKRHLAQVYHPDAFAEDAPSLRETATRRMQEINAAADRMICCEAFRRRDLVVDPLPGRFGIVPKRR